jgi:hypothetical protein
VTMLRVVQEQPGIDACPWCRVTLGQPRGATRRLIVLSPRPGLLCWRCPDCQGAWAVRSVRDAAGEDPHPPLGHGARTGAPRT